MDTKKAKTSIRIKDLWSYDFVETLFSSNQFGVILVSLDQQILDSTPVLCEKLGYSREELTGKSISDITHPEDLVFTNKLFERAAESNFYDYFEKRYVSKDGRILWFKLRSQAVRNDEGDALYRIVIAEDITREKQTESDLMQLAAIIEASDDAVFRCNAEGIIEFWSKGAERLYGFTAEEVIGKQSNEIFTSKGNTHLQQSYTKLVEGQPISELQTVTRHKNGKMIEVSVKIFPIKDEQDEITGYGTIHRNVTEFNQLQDQLRHSQRMETAGLLAGGIAHDFNNILTVIQGSCNFIEQEMDNSSSAYKHLEVIERSSERASRMTRQLLAFSRKQNRMPEVMDPNVLLEDLAAMLKRTLGEHINLETTLDSTWSIREDPTQLEQIVLNLTLNAKHAMQNKGGTISIKTRDVKIGAWENAVPPGKFRFSPDPVEPGSYVQLTVTDTGIGMERETLEHIFDPFFTTKAEGEGTGLGLSVVYGIMAQSGGSIRVTTEVNSGTEFQILFPRSKGSPEKKESRPSKEMQAGKGSILVLEDNEDVRNLSATLLKKAGYTVTVAENPKQILENEVDGDVDLILSDVIMPGMSGPEFSEIWLDKHPNANFLFMSGFFDESNATDTINSQNLIYKPFKPAELLDRVSRMLEQ